VVSEANNRLFLFQSTQWKSAAKRSLCGNLLTSAGHPHGSTQVPTRRDEQSSHLCRPPPLKSASTGSDMAGDLLSRTDKILQPGM
jgi:hypothetical protein